MISNRGRLVHVLGVPLCAVCAPELARFADASLSSSHGPPRLSESDRSPLVAVSPDGTVTQCRHERQWGGCRGTVGVVQGSFHFEVTMRDEGICRVGWASVAGNLDLGRCAHGYGFGGTGMKSHGGKFTKYGEPFTKGDTVGCFLTLQAGKPGSVGFSKNGAWLGEAFQLPPSVKGPLFPAVAMKNAELEVVFGGAGPASFKFPAPAPVAQHLPLAAGTPPAVRPAASAAPPPATSAGRGNAMPLVLIVEPARDLAEQTAAAVDKLGKDLSPPVSTLTLVGGGGSRGHSSMLAALRKRVDVVTATPGCLLGHVQSGKLDLTGVRLLVLDEADQMASGESLKDLERIWEALHSQPKSGARRAQDCALQVCFFSATLHSPEVEALGGRLCHRPTWVDLKGKDSVPETVHHAVVVVDPTADVFQGWQSKSGPCAGVPDDGVHKADATPPQGAGHLSPEAWSAAVKQLKPALLVDLIDALDMTQVLVFCRTNLDCTNLQEYLTQRGGGARFVPGRKAESGKENPYSCCVLAGARSMGERRAALAAFKEGDVRVLIATDVAARGLDVKELPYVVNMTLPDEPENYIHRIGRVGRAERMGLAISLVSAAQEKVWFYDKRKWAGKALSTALANKGGCCIWYDEPGLLASVEHRLRLVDTPARPAAGMGGRAMHGGGRGQAALSPASIALPTVTVQRQGCAPWGGKSGQGATGSTDSAKAGATWGFSLPPGMGGGEGVYGAAVGGGSSTNHHVAAIAPTVEVLMELELAAQSSFLALQASFQGCAEDLELPTPVEPAAVPRAPVPPAAAGKGLAAPPAAPAGAGGRGQASKGGRSGGQKRRGGGRGSHRPGKRGRGGALSA